MIVRIDSDRRVFLRASIDLPVPPAFVWTRMREFERFTSLDPIHHRIRVLDADARPGAQIVIEHRFTLIRMDRVGRILRWSEGEGYTISDLSKRGPGCGFPHILDYRVAPRNTGSRWTITVRGKWTSPVVPRWVASLWMRWILAHICGAVERDTLRALRVHNAAMRRSISSPRNPAAT